MELIPQGDLLNPYMTQQQIAEQNGYTSNSKISDFKNELLSKIPELGKIDKEELQEADLDFLMDYRHPQKRPYHAPRANRNAHKRFILKVR